MRSLIFILFFISPFSLAFKFSPMSFTLDENGKGKTSLIYVENDSSSPIALQISMAKRVMDEQGREKHPDAEDDFLVYPPQMILKAKQKRSIKVTWLGEKKLVKEEAYRVIVEQLPIDLKMKKGQSGIKVLLRYIGAVYVNPGKTNSKIIIDKSLLNKDTLSFSVKNSGTRHQVLKNLKLVLNQNEENLVIDSDLLPEVAGENILPGSTRQFKVLIKNNPFKNNHKLKVGLDFEK